MNRKPKLNSELSRALAWMKQNVSREELARISIGEILSQYRAQLQMEALTK
jgi:hypothetical protein